MIHLTLVTDETYNNMDFSRPLTRYNTDSIYLDANDEPFDQREQQ